MPETPGDRNDCLEISLQSVASQIRASDGSEIPFKRAILTIRNKCDSDVLDLDAHAALGQEGGTVQDVSGSFSQSGRSSIPYGGAVEWDVYDLLIPLHPGTSSKIHMFGYRAALNWRFELSAWASYRPSGAAKATETPVSRWAFRWSVKDPSSLDVELTIEELKESI